MNGTSLKVGQLHAKKKKYWDVEPSQIVGELDSSSRLITPHFSR